MSDKLHWSFGDSLVLREKIFPEGFSAPKSTLPAEAFSPAANWENAYDLVYTGTDEQYIKKNCYAYFGSLRIGAQFEKDRLHLKVQGIRQMQEQEPHERQHLEAESTCRRDALFSLEDGAAWNLRLRLKHVLDVTTKPYSQMDETGRFQQGRIEKRSDSGDWRTYRTTSSEFPLVSDWALLAAVQSLPRDQEFRFGHFQQLERYCPGHRIRFLETFAARFGDNEITLHGYAHTGQGITPRFYWVDDHGRLLIARFTLSALVYNPNPHLEKEALNDI